MIYKKQYGQPFDTESVVGSFLPMMETIPYLTKEPDGFSYAMEPQDVLYGLGENVRGINKRGWVYESKCSDDGNHTEGKSSLYGAYNFMIVSGKDTFGFFIDYPGKVTFDCGYTDMDTLRITVAEENYDLYIIEGESLTDIVHQFRQLVGRSYIPPKWAFGNAQSRWSYMNEDEVREVVANYRANHMPLDAVVLDIDYMERYKDFTVDAQRFPRFADFAAEMKAQGIHLVPIIDAGVKIEDGYDVYEEGVKNGYFCTNQDGTPFVAGVWPGRVHFPDMLNPEARAWFGSQYKVLLDQGIEGFWNDMNEPAIFYAEERLKKTFAKIGEYNKQNLDISSFAAFTGMVAELSNNENDYKLFYHNTKQGRMRHDKVHNLFGYNMTRAAGDAFERLEPDKRILMYSRSACIGMHRYGGIWTGDNHSWWSHILLALHMMPSLNMCGFLYEGPDIGGFGSNTTEDLVLRWYGMGIFSPLLRNHSAKDTRRQEPYRFKNKAAFAGILQLRYLLLPYIYSEYMKAALHDEMYCMPLAFAFPEDDFARRVEDEVMIGESLLIAPVYEQNARGRYVYLPEEMLQVRVKCSESNRIETSVLPAGHHYIPVELDEVVFFMRKGHILPLAKGGKKIQNVADVDFTDLRLLAYAPDGASYEYYTDDGETKDYDKPEHFVHITLDADGNAKSDRAAVKVNRGAAGILLQLVKHARGLEDLNDLLVDLVVHVGLASGKDVDVRTGFFGFGVILVNGVGGLQTSVGDIIIVDDACRDLRVLQGVGDLFGLQRGDLDLGLGFVDVLRSRERRPIALHRHQACSLEHADGTGLVGLVVRNWDGAAFRNLVDVLVLGGIHTERVDCHAADRLQILVVLHIVVGQIQ